MSAVSIADKIEMSAKQLLFWKRSAELESRYGLGPGWPPSMSPEEIISWDIREQAGTNIGQKQI